MKGRKGLKWSNRMGIISEAYDLGYRVGLYSHSDRVLTRAKTIGVLKDVEEAYERGRSEGRDQRERLLMTGLTPEEEHQRTRTRASNGRGIKIIGTTYSDQLSRGYPKLLRRISFYATPRFMRYRASRRPRLLNVPRFLKP